MNQKLAFIAIGGNSFVDEWLLYSQESPAAAGARGFTEGRIYTTSQGGVHVFDKSGKKLGVIETPEHPANVCFGGDQFDTLFITARTSLYMCKTLAVGYRSRGGR